MARYMVEYTQLNTGKRCECDIRLSLSEALSDSQYVKDLNVAKTILILRDQEGTDHIDNTGKFFLYRIIK